MHLSCFISFSGNNLLCLYWLIVGLNQVGTGVPCSPFTSSASRVPSTDPDFFCLFGVTFSPVQCSCWLVSRVVMGGVGWRGWGVCIDSWCPHLKRFSPAPSSHWGCCTLIRCAGTRDPRKQR